MCIRHSNKSIHQPLWKEPNFTLEDAFFYSNKLVLDEIEAYSSNEKISVIDLGCGVGSSIFYLQERVKRPTIFYGVTISPTQVAIAKQRIAKLQLIPSVSFIEADFTNLPATIPLVDIAFSIEAFAHAADAHQFFAQISQKLKNGGKLILVDDFLNDALDLSKLDQKGQQAIQDFKYGWLVNSLKTRKELSTIASNYNLKIIQEENLTPYMRNNSFKHKWISFLVTSFRWLYDLLPWKSFYFRSWIGGKGKQYCLRKKIVQYKHFVFQKAVSGK